MRTTQLILLALLIYLNGCIQIAVPPVDDYITILISLAGVKKTSPTQQAPTPTPVSTPDPVLSPLPPKISYSGSPFVLTQNLPINPITPTITGTITSCLPNPTLPSGLSLDNTTCTISGTPTATQTAANYTITASNSSGNATATISITVNLAPPTALTYPASSYAFLQNSPIATQTPTVNGTVTNCVSVPNLPTGLNLDTTTCTITGMPTNSQSTTSYTITASNDYGNTTTTISITIDAPVTGVSLVATSTVPLSGTVTLTPVFTPSNASNQNVTWSSSNTSVATVSNGIVTGVAIGTATITVTTADGGYTGTCLITVPVTIGSLYAGGIVFYVDGTGLHGFVAATTDQSTGKAYGVAPSTPQTFGTGSSNTNAIIAANGGLNTTYAAGVARSYTGGGYNDWFLPSMYEAQTMLNNIGVGGGNIGNFTNANYWSSSKVNPNPPNFYNPMTTFINAHSTATLDRVRAIRAF